jgi:hypothetical protein
MTPTTSSTDSTRVVRALHRLFPSRSVVVTAAIVEVAFCLVGMPLGVHILAALVVHALILAVRR